MRIILMGVAGGSLAEANSSLTVRACRLEMKQALTSYAFAPNPQVLGAGSLSELQLGLFLARKKGNVLLSSHARAGMQSG